MDRVTALLDYKIVPELDRLILARGRRIKLASNPLIAKSEPGSKATELSKNCVHPELLDFALLRLEQTIGSQGLGPNGEGDEQRGSFQLPTVGHKFHPDEGLLILGHPQLQGDSGGGPLKLTYSSPAAAALTPRQSRVRYSVNTEGGNSGSPVMDQELRPVALHQLGSGQRPAWDEQGDWMSGFNQGIPLDLIVKEIQRQVKDNATLADMNLVASVKKG